MCVCVYGFGASGQAKALVQALNILHWGHGPAEADDDAPEGLAVDGE